MRVRKKQQENNKLKVFWHELNNAGDQFNHDLFNWLCPDMERTDSPYDADLLMLGGAMSRLQKPELPVDLKPLHIWGTGFLFGDDNDLPLSRPNLKVHALRGQLSKDKINELLDISLPKRLPLADPGLLASYFASQGIEKEYRIGFIPHYREQDTVEVQRILQANSSMHYIDITLSPREVIREIQMCETVVSSSLHGLVFSDSLGVPNVHTRITELPLGGSFKFRDYYSAFGLSDPALTPDDVCRITAEEIADIYAVDRCEVEKKKRQLMKSFPKSFRGNAKRKTFCRSHQTGHVFGLYQI